MDNDALRQSDLATQEDNRLRSHISEYEKKIESLMAEVGTLKNEVSKYFIVQNFLFNCFGSILVFSFYCTRLIKTKIMLLTLSLLVYKYLSFKVFCILYIIKLAVLCSWVDHNSHIIKKYLTK